MDKQGEPKRILMVAGRMHYGGIEAMIMNLFRHVDREKVVFDFLLNYEEPGVYDDEIRALGGRIYIVPRLFLHNTFSYIKAVNKFFDEHKEYDIVHGHLTSVARIYLDIARKHGVKTTIVHAHNTAIKRRLKWFVERTLVVMARNCADYYFACSNAAGKYCFGKKRLSAPNYKKFNNGIIVDNYAFNESVRASKRAELSLEDKFVVGNVGRFVPQKNHKQLIEIFAEVKKLRDNAVLVLAGDGVLMETCKQQVRELGIEDSVMFLGMRPDAQELLMAMDVFLLPSFYEGLPVAGIEAQAAGLMSFYSDTITDETDVTGLCHYLPLEMSAHEWAEQIVKHGIGYERRSQKDELVKAGYDVASQAKWLTDFYLSR